MVPAPGAECASSSVPPSPSARRRDSARPRPLPPKRNAIVPSPCWNGANSASACAVVSPMPVSHTSITSGAPSPAPVTRTVTVPRSVNLIALPMRLVRIWRSRLGSVAISAGGVPAGSTTRRTPLRSASIPRLATTSATTASGAVATDASSRRPASTFARSNRSSTRASSTRPFDSTRAIRSARRSAETPSAATSSPSARIAESGVRISWLMLRRKMVLARLASSASSFARRNPAVANCSSPTSTLTPCAMASISSCASDTRDAAIEITAGHVLERDEQLFDARIVAGVAHDTKLRSQARPLGSSGNRRVGTPGRATRR